MNQLDLISKRILVIAASICAVLLSATLLIKTATRAEAQTFPNDITYNARLDVAGGAPVVFMWNTKTGTYKWPNSWAGENLNNKNW